MSAHYVDMGRDTRVVPDWRAGNGVSPYTNAQNYARAHGAATVLRADGTGVVFTRVDERRVSKRTIKDMRPKGLHG